MIANIVREFHWEPVVIDRLFLDEQDHHGLIYWNNNVEEMHKELNK